MCYVFLTRFCGGEKPGEGTYGDWAICKPTCCFNQGCSSLVLVNKNCKVKAAVGKVIDWMTLDTTEDGYQYYVASGASGNEPQAVPSGRVLDRCENGMDFLKGQNCFEVLKKLGSCSRGETINTYNEVIENGFCEEVRAYATGKKSRKQAISDFKSSMAEKLNIKAE